MSTTQTAPFTLAQIGTGTARFPSGVPIPTHTDQMVDPYFKSKMPKEHQVDCLLFWPQQAGTYPGVVLLHDRWGLTGQMKDLGARLACEGYTVIIPNLYGRLGGMVTASDDGTVKIWNASTGKELLTLTGHTGNVYGVAFSPDGKTIASASGDKTAKVWDTQTGKQYLTLHAPYGLTSVAFSPDGSQLAVASRDGIARIYLLRIEELIALARQRITRTLTNEECQQYLHVEQCPAGE